MITGVERLIEKRNLNKLLLLVSLVIFSSCKAQKYTFNEVKMFESTHTIKKDTINKILTDIKSNNKIFDSSSNTIVFYIEKKKKDSYKMSITKTDFELFKENKSDYYFSNLKGYFMYNDILVLLYGNVTPELFERTDKKLIKNIMNCECKDEIPIIYEPTFIDYVIK